jgi:hypothetical protein
VDLAPSAAAMSPCRRRVVEDDDLVEHAAVAQRHELRDRADVAPRCARAADDTVRAAAAVVDVKSR